jgi:hypothetical protein
VLLSASDDGVVQSTLTMTAALLDHNAGTGVFADGASVQIYDSVVRDTGVEVATGTGGKGFDVNSNSGVPPTLELVRVVIERSHEAGVLLAGGQGTFTAMTVRDTLPAAGMFGRGLSLQILGDQRSVVTISSSVVAVSEDIGIFIAGSDVSLDGVVVRDTQSETSELGGHGVFIQVDVDVVPPSPANVTLTRCVVDSNRTVGVHVAGSDVSLDDSVVTRTSRSPEGLFGDGVTSVFHVRASSVAVAGSIVADNDRAGVSVFGSGASLTNTALSCNGINLNAQGYQGEAPVFVNGGLNQCGCGAVTKACKVVSTDLEPPEALN